VIPVRAVEDTEVLALYIQEGAPFAFAKGEFPGGPHPYSTKERWHGHGALTLQWPGEAHSIFVFWRGPQREFAGWYVNFQAPYRRAPRGIDTLDHELDIWIPNGGDWVWKDRDQLERRVAEGRFTPADAETILGEGDRVAARLDRGERWWDEAWAAWQPDPAWAPPAIPPDWDA